MKDNPTLLQELPRSLGEGLVLRRSTPEDAQELAEFNARVHSDDGPDKPDMYIQAWVRDLLTKPHPTFQPEDFTVVEEPRTGKIVSSLNLISQTWSYDGIRFGVGRPELVGTLDEYRNKGLIRAQFEVVHDWSARRGELVQAITGIPYYYRQFGYEMTVSLGGGWRGSCVQAPRLKPEEQEPVLIRPAQEADIGLIDRLYRQGCQRYALNCEWDESLWRYELLSKDPINGNRSELRVIESPDGQALGFLAHWARNWGNCLALSRFELLPGVSYGLVTPAVMRYLCKTGEAYAQAATVGTAKTEAKPFGMVELSLGEEHPAYQAMPVVFSQKRRAYAWFIRVPDLAAFLRHIAPALEARLMNSAFAGHSGELKISFYRSGLLLGLEQGRLTKIEPWRPQPQGHSGDAAFPGLTFLHVLFGHRSLDEVRNMFVDCWCEHDTASGLLKAMFPKRVASLWPIS